MTQKEQVLAALTAALPALRKEWPIRSLAIFGSVAREEASAESDLDVLVEFQRPIALSSFLRLEETLSEIAGRPVDLVSRASLKPFIGARILSEAVPV
jgi:predicted nucleotidyltransferase